MLTRSQLDIISNLTSEFMKLNEVENSSSGGVLDVSDIIEQRDSDIKLLEQIKLSNTKYKELLRQTIENDCDRIRPDLHKLNLDCRICWGTSLLICRKTDMDYNNLPDKSIRIDYRLKYENISFDSNIPSTAKVTTIENVAIGNNVWYSVDAVFKGEYFKQQLKSLYNSTFPNT